MFLLDDILLAPIKGVIWLGKKIQEQAEKELYDEAKIKEELMSLQSSLELGKITEEEYKRQEEKLLKRLEEVRKYKEEKAKEEVK